MNILMITPDFPYSFGGIGEHVYHLVKEMNKSDITIHLFIARFAESKLGIRDVQEELGDRVILHEIKCKFHKEIEFQFRENKPEGFFYEYEAIKTCAHNIEVFQTIQSFIKRSNIDFDLLHVHDAFDAIDSLALGKMFDIPTIVTAHSVGNEKYLIDGMRKYIFCNADKVIYVSKSLYNSSINRYSLSGENSIVIPNGIEESVSLKQDFSSSNSLVYVGRLEQKKGVDLLINAIKYIIDKYGELYSLNIYGEGTEEKNLKVMIQDYSLEQYIHINGYQPHEKIKEAYKNADLVVVPSRYEAFGLVVIEAMNERCAVLCSDIEPFQEIIVSDKSGVFFRNQDIQDLGDKIVELMKDESRRRYIAYNAVAAVRKKYSWNEISKATKEEYIKMINN